MNTKELVNWINELYRNNTIDRFYNSKYFKRVKYEVMREQHYECQRCKEKGKLTIVKPKHLRSKDNKRNGVVHHVKEVRDNPGLALSKYYIDKQGRKQRQLIVLCDECHEIVHNRFKKKELLNIERW